MTEGSGEGAGITAAVGVGDDGTDPETDSSWTWTTATYNADKDGLVAGDLANDEYEGDITAPSTSGSYDYAYRFSTDGGLSWRYVDLGGDSLDGPFLGRLGRRRPTRRYVDRRAARSQADRTAPPDPTTRAGHDRDATLELPVQRDGTAHEAALAAFATGSAPAIAPARISASSCAKRAR